MTIFRQFASFLKKIFKKRKSRKTISPRQRKNGSLKRNGKRPQNSQHSSTKKSSSGRKSSALRKQLSLSIRPKTQDLPQVKLPLTKVIKKDQRSLHNTEETFSKKKGALIGEITHFFPKIQVGVVKVSSTSFKVGDEICVSGKDTQFRQKVGSLQVESIDVSIAKIGQLVGLKLSKPARVGDKIFKA